MWEMRIWWMGMNTDLFERILDHEAHSPDLFHLSHAVDAAEGLLFNHWVPLRLHKVGCGGGGKI